MNRNIFLCLLLVIMCGCILPGLTENNSGGSLKEYDATFFLEQHPGQYNNEATRISGYAIVFYSNITTCLVFDFNLPEHYIQVIRSSGIIAPAVFRIFEIFPPLHSP
ncbi:MAG: hypothetical protein ABIJ16_09265 [Bacteroidota bacterium]